MDFDFEAEVKIVSVEARLAVNRSFNGLKRDSAQKAVIEAIKELPYQWHYGAPFLAVGEKEASCMVHLNDAWPLIDVVMRMSGGPLSGFIFTVSDPASFLDTDDFIMQEMSEEIFDQMGDKDDLYTLISDGSVYAIPRGEKIDRLPISSKYKLEADIIDDRIKNAYKQKFYHVKLTMPEKIFAFLKENPDFLGRAVEAVGEIGDFNELQDAMTSLHDSNLCVGCVEGVLRFTKRQYYEVLNSKPQEIISGDIGARIYAGMKVVLKQSGRWNEYVDTVYDPYSPPEVSADQVISSDSDDFDNFSDYSDYDYAECNVNPIRSEDSDYDSELEVLEAIKNDPDLFMKIMEMQQGDKGEIAQFIEQLKGVQVRKPTGRQKGLADCKTRADDSESEWSDLENDDDELYSETIAQIKQRMGNIEIQSD